MLWVRPLDSAVAQALPGTEGAISSPFWSPDSRSIGFFAGGKLKRIAVDGGPAQTLCDAPDGRGGTWNRDGIIVFAPSGSPGPLQRVAAVGGLPAPVTKIEGGDLHRFPEFLPDGRRFLYLVSGGNPDKDGVNVGSLDRQPARRLVAEQSSAAWLPPPTGSKDGYLLFVRDSTLMAQPFDTRTIQPTGDPFPVAEEVSYGFNVNNAMVSISRNGVLVYWGGASIGSMGENQLVWYDRAGKALGNVGAPARTLYFALSPDEKSVAAPRRAGSGNNTDIWLHEIARGVETRFTFHAL
jgi:hypothetical protein